MGALSRLLDKDAAAKAVLLAVLGTAPIPAAADAVKAHPAKAPVAKAVAKPAQLAAAAIPAPSGEVTPEQILVALQGEASKLGKVVGMLRASTDECLSEQARLLTAVSDPSTERGVALAAVAVRGNDLRELLKDDPAMEAHNALMATGHIINEDYDTLERHARLRNACLDWSDRTVAFLKDSLSEPKAEAVSGRLAAARAASARDLGRLMAMGPTYDGNGSDAIEAMEIRAPGM